MTNTSEFTGVSRLEEMKLMARGNPDKIAEYKLAERVYNDTIAEVFDEGNPFMSRPDERYIAQLKEDAETGDDAAKARLAIAEERAKHFAYKRDDEQIVNNATKADLLRKLADGSVTKEDVKLAEKYARTFTSNENIAMYTQIKRAVEAE